MFRPRPMLAVILALLMTMPLIMHLHAQEATSEEGGVISVAASGLTNPRGMTWDDEGALYVAEAGTGGEPPATAAVAVIQDGCPVVIAGDLPSATAATGEVTGAVDVAFLGDTLYVLISGGDAEAPNGVYTVEDDGTTTLLVDLGAWIRDNPVASPPEAAENPDGAFVAMTAADDGSALQVVERVSGQVLSVTAEGAVTRFADLSAIDLAPTAITPASNGGLYIGFLGNPPFRDGSAKVIRVEADGFTTDVWTGLTMVTGLAVGPDGALYAAEMATGNRQAEPYFQSGTGRIVRQSGPDAADAVATGLNSPMALDLGPDGAFYVSVPAAGEESGGGMILRLDTALGAPSAVPAEMPAAANCAATPPAVPSPDAQADAQDVVIAIIDFAFEPADATVAVGDTVTWVNEGPTDHTTVTFEGGDKVWDSGIMQAGDEYSFTFEEPGSYDYICGLHPEMEAHLDVGVRR